MINDNYTGWIKLHRSILEWEWWDDRNARDLFIYCLLKANHEDVKWHGQIIERGTFITSRDELAKKTGLTIQQTRTALEKLISTSEITKQTTNKITIITICNYDKYQELQPIEQPTEQPDNQPTNNQQITNKQPTNNHKQEYKEGEEIKKYNIPPYNPPTGDEKPKRTRKAFVRPTLDEVAAYCQERNNGIDPQAFIDYYDSCGWMVGNKPMKDWKAAVRTWENKRKANHPQQPISAGEPQRTEEKNGITIPSEMERARAAFKF